MGAAVTAGNVASMIGRNVGEGAAEATGPDGLGEGVAVRVIVGITVGTGGLLDWQPTSAVPVSASPKAIDRYAIIRVDRRAGVETGISGNPPSSAVV
jgi:hypothetical protein